jgi:hypothetical protein
MRHQDDPHGTSLPRKAMTQCDKALAAPSNPFEATAATFCGAPNATRKIR